MGGPRVLDFLLGEGDTPCVPLPTESHVIPPDEPARSARLRRMTLAAKALPVNRATAMQLIRLSTLQEELLGTSSAGAREVLSASLDSMLGALSRLNVDEVRGSVGTDGGDRHDPGEVMPDPVIIDDPVGIDVLKFAGVVAATLAEGAPEGRATGARRGA
jgi:hypothetical protein